MPEILVRDPAAPVRTSGRIAALLDLHERCYRLLERLIPDARGQGTVAVSQVANDVPLRLVVEMRSRYTSVFHLTYAFGEDGEQRQPDLQVRMYHDLRLAEALTCPHRPEWLARAGGDPAAERFLDDQWGRNILLQKWLEYLTERGHRFGIPGTSAASEAAAA